MDMNGIEKVFEDIKTILLRIAPASYFLLKQLRIEYIDKDGIDYMFGSDGEPIPVHVRASTNGTTITLYRQWAELERIEDKIAVLLHELYHVILRHPVRGANFIKQYGTGDIKNDKNIQVILNICMDAKVNYIISKFLNSGILNIPPYFSEDELEKCSIEELFFKFFERSGGFCSCSKDNNGATVYINGDSSDSMCSGMTGGHDVRPYDQNEEQDKGNSGDSKDSGGGGKVLNEGSNRFAGKTGQELEEEINNAVRDALLAAKTAGANLSAIEQRILDELVKPKVNWRSQLRQTINDGIMKNVLNTWTRVNRKLANSCPGKKIISVPDVWCFVDVSGSIGPKEWKQFMSEVLEITKHGGIVNLILWDTEVTGEYKLRRKSQIIDVEFSGGGGTTFTPIIKKYQHKIRPRDMIVVLTDGYWFDTEQAVEILNKFGDRVVLCTTGEVPQGLMKSKNIKIDIN